MFYNTKFRLWNRVANWWLKFKPICSHWFHVISPTDQGRKEIEVSECRWCNQLTSDLYIKGETYDNHFKNIKGYGPVEACPVTDDPPLEIRVGPVITLNNKELYFERHSNVVETNRGLRASTKAASKSRRVGKSTSRSKRRS